LALDDYNDNEDIIYTSTMPDIAGNDNMIEDTIDFYVNKVDLGLPSRTLWCKYNVGVNMHELNDAEDWGGNYYAWGEIYPKRSYGFFNYEYSKYNENQTEDDLDVLTKYCSDFNFSHDMTTDNLVELERSDMPIKLKLRKGDNINKYSMPTYDQYNELIKYTTSKYVKNYNGIIGLNGKLFTSKINKKSIFFPAVGYMNDNELHYDAMQGGYWTSTVVKGMDVCAWTF